VFKALATALNFPGNAIEERLETLKDRMFRLAQGDIEIVALKRAKKTIERALVQSASSARTLGDLTGQCATSVAQLDFAGVVNSTRTQLDAIIGEKDYEALLKVYGFKGALAEVAKILNLQNQKSVEQQINMILAKGENTALHHELVNLLPRFT
jgi:hypothetical protein